jgi:hypothetical protein
MSGRWTTSIDPKWDNGSPKNPLRSGDPYLTNREVSGSVSEIFIGTYANDLIEVFASMDYGVYSTYDKTTKEHLENTYTAKDVKRYESHLSVWHSSKGVPSMVNAKAWSLGKVAIHAYYRGRQLDTKREIPMVEYGACPEANLLDAGSKEFEILYPREAIFIAMRERGTTLLAEVIADAVIELDEIQKELYAGLRTSTLTSV